MTLAHETHTLSRDIACPPARLFHLLTDGPSRALWNAPDAETKIEIDHADIRPGGHELARCGPASEPHFSTRNDFHLIDESTHLISTESLMVEGQAVSIALITQSVAAIETGARLTVTLQMTSLTGDETFAEYHAGWTGALDNIARLAEAAAEV